MSVWTALLEWVREHDTLMWCLGAFSVLTVVGTPVVVGWLVARLPSDYFSAPRRRAIAGRSPLGTVLLIVAKNLLGVLVVLAGVAMLVLPGQGLLTILIGLGLLDFPGKYMVERWLVTRPGIRRAVDWLRRRAGREPFDLPAE